MWVRGRPAKQEGEALGLAEAPGAGSGSTQRLPALSGVEVGGSRRCPPDPRPRAGHRLRAAPWPAQCWGLQHPLRRRLVNPAAIFPREAQRRGEFGLFFPTPTLLRASEERKYVRRTGSSREVWRWAGVDCKDSLQCAAPSWPLCVPSMPGSHTRPAQTVWSTGCVLQRRQVVCCCQGQSQKRRSGPV